MNSLEPNESLKKELYKIYTEIFKSTILSENKKIKVLNTLFAYEPWSWRVVGISKLAIRTFVKNKFIFKSGIFQRDHSYQGRDTTIREMLKKHMPFEKWWPWFWDNDKTVIVTKGEHRTQEYIYRFKKEIIEIDWREGYFKCQKTVGFHYTKKKEGIFIKVLATLNNIKGDTFLE